MFYDAENGSIPVGDSEMDYISFGSGTPLVMIPGLGEGLKTVKGLALPFALLYRSVARKYRVYAFSRRNVLPQSFTTKDMAEDIYFAMKELKLEKAMVIGISLGGMVAQYLAINHPEVVEKLLLTVTLARQNETVQQKLACWMELARKENYKEIMIDTAESSYTENYLKKGRKLYGIFDKTGNPETLERFLIMAEAGRTHDSYEELGKITCPTLVIGGAQDKIVSGAAAAELAERIPGSSLYVYEDYGHGLYMETRDFVPRMLAFFGENKAKK